MSVRRKVFLNPVPVLGRSFMMDVAQVGEFGLIEQLKPFQNLSRRIIRGMGDDAAVLEHDRKYYQLLTTDMMAEGVHFLRSTPPRSVGHKAMGCNISDIAAMGGLPTQAVVSLGVPKGLSLRHVREMYEGMYRLARRFHVSIVGGDTISTPHIVINVALLGLVEKKSAVFRSGAGVGDGIFVTGRLGGSLRSGRHATFIPKVEEARFLVRTLRPTAMIDVSDGLAGDLGHILKQSGVEGEIEEELIPCHRGATVEQALFDGEDYELVFTLPAGRCERLKRAGGGKFSFFRIGTITRGPARLVLKRGNGKKVTLKAKGFTHF